MFNTNYKFKLLKLSIKTEFIEPLIDQADYMMSKLFVTSIDFY